MHGMVTLKITSRPYDSLQVLGLYKGLSSPLYGLAAINAIVFGVQGNIQRRMSNPESLSSHFFAGSVAGTAQCVICSPMELAKTRMQVQGQGESLHKYRHTKHSYTGPVDCLIKVYKTEGVRGVFRGMGLTIARETPSFGVYFVAYEYLCRLFREGEERVGVLGLLLAGGMAGMASWTSTYPADVIKSRIQADMTNEYKGFWDCCVKSYRSEGIAFFSKGLCSTLLRAFPVNAATFGGVELVLRLARDSAEDDGSYELSTYSSGLHASVPTTATNTTSGSVPFNVVPNLPSHEF